MSVHPSLPRARCQRIILLALLAVPVLLQAGGQDGRLVGRVDHVADGDTLTVRVGEARHRIRLHQVDAPERGQPWGRESRRALADKVDGRYVRLDVETVDDYGRTVATVWLGDRNVNREMLRDGHAWAYRKYLRDRSLIAVERAARDARRGLWRAVEPVAPWEWRRAARASSGDPPPSGQGCQIKGNINRRGDRIYHRPGDRHYPNTRIDVDRGERWFCSVAEAVAAGWRAPR